MQASLAVDRVWIDDGELTVDCGVEPAPRRDVRFAARRTSDGARVAGTATAEDDHLILRLPLAELAPAGPGAEDWSLQAAITGATLSLTPGPTYEHVPDAARAFAFPAGRVEAGGTPRRFRPSYDGMGALAIHSMPPARRAPASAKAAGRARRRRRFGPCCAPRVLGLACSPTGSRTPP